MGVFVLIAVIIWAGVWLIATRLLAGHFAWSWALRDARGKRREYPSLYKRLDPDSAEPHFGWWLLAGFVGAIAALVWPAVLISGHFPKIGAEREAERRRMKARIAELEREAGL